jgi:hypothetical protein
LRDAQNLINVQDKAGAFNQDDEINSDGEIFLISETLREPLMHIANKLLGRQRLNFEQLTTPEQQLWSLFEKSDIFEFLTEQTDTVPQFENYFTFDATLKVNIDIQRIAKICILSLTLTINSQFKGLCQILHKWHISFVKEKQK